MVKLICQKIVYRMRLILLQEAGEPVFGVNRSCCLKGPGLCTGSYMEWQEVGLSFDPNPAANFVGVGGGINGTIATRGKFSL